MNFLKNNFSLIIGVILLLVIVFVQYKNNQLHDDLQRVDQLERERDSLERLRFRESEIHDSLQRLKQAEFEKKMSEIKSQIKYVPYEKQTFIYYGADSVLAILNRAKY